MTETDLYRELFYLARRNFALACKVLVCLSDSRFDFNILEKYFSSRDQNELALLREIIPRIDPSTVTKEMLVKKTCNLNKPSRAKNFYAGAAIELFLKEMTYEEIFKIIPHISGLGYIDRIKEEVKSRDKDSSSYESLIFYQNSGEKPIREISRDAILTIPKEFLSCEKLLSEKLKNPLYSDREISIELLIIHFENDMSNELLMKSLLYSNETITAMVRNVLNKRFSEGKLTKNFIEKYLGSKHFIQFEIAIDFSLQRDLDEEEQKELSNFCSEFIF